MEKGQKWKKVEHRKKCKLLKVTNREWSKMAEKNGKRSKREKRLKWKKVKKGKGQK